MNYKLAREIYGLNPWFMDSHSFPSLSSLLQNLSNGIPLEVPELKLNSTLLYKIENETRIVDRPYGNVWNPGQLDNSDEFTGIGVVNIDGPITKSGGMSSFGMMQKAADLLKMNQDKRMAGFMILGDSGGGSSAAVKIMTDAIDFVRASGKPVKALVEKGGMSASAMYMIMCACDSIYVESEMSIVGSNGTMVQFDGRKANTEDPNGKKHIRLYATKSIKKNEDFEEALNNDNYEVIINELLDPINEEALKSVISYRPMLSGTNYDSGEHLFAKNGIGTYIDGISSFSGVVSMIESEMKIDLKNKSNSNINNKSKNKAMTAEELKSQHPATYNAIFNAGKTAGVESEKDRVGSWMAHSATDLDEVKSGIESGKDISATKREEFLVKANSKEHLENIKGDNADELDTTQSGKEKQKTESEIFYSELQNEL